MVVPKRKKTSMKHSRQTCSNLMMMWRCNFVSRLRPGSLLDEWEENIKSRISYTFQYLAHSTATLLDRIQPFLRSPRLKEETEMEKVKGIWSLRGCQCRNREKCLQTGLSTLDSLMKILMLLHHSKMLQGKCLELIWIILKVRSQSSKNNFRPNFRFRRKMIKQS